MLAAVCRVVIRGRGCGVRRAQVPVLPVSRPVSAQYYSRGVSGACVFWRWGTATDWKPGTRKLPFPALDRSPSSGNQRQAPSSSQPAARYSTVSASPGPLLAHHGPLRYFGPASDPSRGEYLLCDPIIFWQPRRAACVRPRILLRRGGLPRQPRE